MDATQAQDILQGFDLDVRCCGLEEPEVERTGDMQRAIAALEGPGWACFAGRVVTFSTSPPAEGLLLMGESAPAPDQSVHVRHDGDEWVIVRFNEVPGADLLAIDESHVSSAEGPAEASLRYRVYWGPRRGGEPDEPWRPLWSRFLGFSEGEKRA